MEDVVVAAMEATIARTSQRQVRACLDALKVCTARIFRLEAVVTLRSETWVGLCRERVRVGG